MNKKSLLFTHILLLSLLLLPACTPVNNTTSAPLTTSADVIQSTTSTTTQSNLILRNREDVIPADAVKILPETDVYPPILHSDMYNTPVPVPGLIDTAGGEDSPFILPDGKTLYFFFTPDVRVPVEQQLFDGATGVYRSVKMEDGTWGEPERVVLNDDIALDGAEFIQGGTMWFCSARAGYEGIHWFTADLIDGKWRNWKYAGGEFPAGYEVGELHFSADWIELYYHSARAGGKGGFDIWYTRNVDGIWQTPVNIDAVNTLETEGWPYLSQDGLELWFLRYYLGSPAIFRSERVNGQWSEPELIISQFAGEPSIDNEGNIYFVHHYYKDGVMLEADIYVAEKK